ncbi:MAG: ABC transporter permease [Candidatus Bathyarchaeota archaeon]|nr:ABC transporter permease [Candidatus Bathyarchaeota archaeon]
MRATTLVLKNISRRKGRSILNSIGLILAIAVIVATFTISSSMETHIGEEVEKYGPNIVVTPDTQSISIPYGNVMVGRSTLQENHLTKLSEIENAENIRTISPKLFGTAMVEGENVLLVGLNADSEVYLKVWWEVTGELPVEDSNEAMMGSEIMSALDLSIGSTVTINDSEFKVVAALNETGSNDDYTVFLPLHVAQGLLGMDGEISLVDIGALCSTCPVEVIAEQITDAIPDVRATPVKQAVETRIKMVEQAANFSLMLASVVMVAGCAGIMNTMVSSVHQRRREIGVFMSLGADNTYIYKIFLFEAVILGLVGGVLGSALGVLSSMIMGPLVLSTPIIIQDIPVFSIPLSIAISVVACLVASLYPTWRATKIDPVSALKAI